MDQGTSIKREQTEYGEDHKEDVKYDTPINVCWYSTMDVRDPLEMLSHETTDHQAPTAEQRFKQNVNQESSRQAADIRGLSGAHIVKQEVGYAVAESLELLGAQEVIRGSPHMGAECQELPGSQMVKQELGYAVAENLEILGAQEVLQGSTQLVTECQELSGVQMVKQEPGYVGTESHELSGVQEVIQDSRHVTSEPQKLKQGPGRLPILTREVRIQLVDVRLYPPDCYTGSGNDMRPGPFPLNQPARKEDTNCTLHNSSELCDAIFSTDQDLFLRQIKQEPAASDGPNVVERIESEARGSAVAGGNMEQQMSVCSELCEVVSCEEDDDGNDYPLLKQQATKNNAPRPKIDVSSKSSSQKSIKNYKNKMCGIGVNQGQLARHEGPNMPEYFECALCNKRFRVKSSLAAHITICNGVRPPNCSTCCKTFNRSSHLKTHSLPHSDFRFFTCSTCGKTFTKSCYLKTHSLTHGELRLFKCSTCGKAFTKSSHLKTHSLTHSDVRLFKCSTCGKAFTKSSYLKAHSLIHRDFTPSNCSTCGNAFTKASYLKAHSLTPNHFRLFTCLTCGKAFTKPGYLKTHSLIHS